MTIFRDRHTSLPVQITAFLALGLTQSVPIPAGYEDACMFEHGHVGTQRCPVDGGRNFHWDIHSPIDGSFPALNNINLESKFERNFTF